VEYHQSFFVLRFVLRFKKREEYVMKKRERWGGREREIKE
jgi:hypothetical protein